LEDLAQHHGDQLEKLVPSGPIRLGGWSLGGVVAFAVASLLRKKGRHVQPLVLLDPSGISDLEVTSWTEQQWVLAWGRDLLGVSGLDPRQLEGIAEDEPTGKELLLRAADRARSNGLLPAGLEESDVRRLFATFRSHVEALAQYRPQTYGGPTLLVLAEPTADPVGEQWRRNLGPELVIETVSADHFSLLRPPALAVWAQTLKDFMKQIEKETPEGGSV